MTIDRQHAALIGLLQRAKPKHATELLEDHETPLQALDALLAGGQLSLASAAGDDVDRAVEEALAQLRTWESEGIEVVTVLDEDYPLNLRTVHDRPPMLTVAGRLAPDDERSVAVVGTRRASDSGLRRAAEIAANLVDAGYVVVSGLAAGIDSASHRAAMDAGGRTIAVIGSGLHHAFPQDNAELQARISREHAVISQFWPDQGPRKHTFPMRNAVMSGIARATVVVEASYTSGARMQARLALEHGRPVVLLDSLVAEHEWAREYAQRPGVYVVERVADVVDRLDSLYAPKLSLAI
jgi:DNA processing protein